MKKAILFSGVIISSILNFACDNKKPQLTMKIDGEKLYKQNCVICHGLDGKLGVNGSKDLTKSDLTLDERVTIITKGKGAMAPYEKVLSKKEIRAIAKYTQKLK